MTNSIHELRQEFLTWQENNLPGPLRAARLLEHQAFLQLVDREVHYHKNGLKRLLIEEDDLRNEICFRLAKLLGDGKLTYEQKGNFEGFLRATIRHKAIDAIRKETAKTKLKITAIPVEALDRFSNANRQNSEADELKGLLEAVDILPEKEKAAFQFRLDGVTYKEAAKQIGVSEKTIQRRVDSAKKILRSMSSERDPKRKKIRLHFDGVPGHEIDIFLNSLQRAFRQRGYELARDPNAVKVGDD